jgi:hypothetical protein
MHNHQIHAALARQRAEEISRHPRSPRPKREWTDVAGTRPWKDVAPVLSVVAGFLGLLAIAAPSL